MKTGTMLTEFESRADDALRALLARFSAIKLIELKHESRGGFAAILARISIYGHNHTLACAANPSLEPARLHEALREFQMDAAPFASDAIPIVIAPYLSSEAQAICKQNSIGFLDFEGNARLNVGDFFIVMRSLPREAAGNSSLRGAAKTTRTHCRRSDLPESLAEPSPEACGTGGSRRHPSLTPRTPRTTINGCPRSGAPTDRS